MKEYFYVITEEWKSGKIDITVYDEDEFDENEPYLLESRDNYNVERYVEDDDGQYTIISTDYEAYFFEDIKKAFKMVSGEGIMFFVTFVRKDEDYTYW